MPGVVVQKQTNRQKQKDSEKQIKRQHHTACFTSAFVLISQKENGKNKVERNLPELYLHKTQHICNVSWNSESARKTAVGSQKLDKSILVPTKSKSLTLSIRSVSSCEYECGARGLPHLSYVVKVRRRCVCVNIDLGSDIGI